MILSKRRSLDGWPIGATGSPTPRRTLPPLFSRLPVAGGAQYSHRQETLEHEKCKQWGLTMRRLVILAAMWAMVSAGCGKDDTTKPTPTGACCAPEGTCTVTTQGNCVTPAAWHSEWVTCSPNPCPQPQAACCNLLTGSCTVTVRDSCAPPSIWYVEWQTCSPNPCTQPNGACCAPDGACTVTTQAACSGTWTTGGVCTPNLCAQLSLTRFDRHLIHAAC
jgi:hypothetical protein